MSPVRVVSEHANHELIEVISGLLEVAKTGDMSGIVFGAVFRGQEFYCEAAGSLHRNPVLALGVAAMLTNEMNYRVRKRHTTDSIV